MESELDLTKIRDEVCRKIGRNLLNFQKIELMLKQIITNSRISGSINDLHENHKERAATVQNKMMGRLVGQLTKNILQNSESHPQLETNPTEPHINIFFKLEMDVESYERKKQELKSLVEDRNDLIHHLLPRFNPDSIESCLEIEKYLDKQQEKLIPEFNYLKSIIQTMKECVEQITSEEYSKAIELSVLQQSPVISTLSEFGVRQCRADGWALMNHAGNYLRTTLPEEILQFERKYGYKTLKQAMLASDLFDFIEEDTKNGGRRLLYRTRVS